jgi:peptidoglycan biosynthesis protein MviN/MurJ (putative lipid II flippase)
MVLLLIAASFLGWLLAAKAHSESQKGDRSVRLLNGVFALVVLLLFIRFNGQYFQAQARYLFPAIGPIACGVAIGLLQLLKNRVTAALVVVAAVLGGVNLFAVSKLPAEFAKRANIVQAP